MSPFLFSMGQDTIDRIHKEELVRAHIEEFGLPSSVTGSRSLQDPTVVGDDADLSVNSVSETNSDEATIDQSVNGISFINLHWASISTGISSLLAVVVLCLCIAGCCYFRGRRQRQSRARHAELLKALSHGRRHSSTPPHPQSGAYPGPSSSRVIRADPLVLDGPAFPSVFDSPIGVTGHPALQFSPSTGAAGQPALQFSPSTASCGLPGCATKYQHSHSSSPSAPSQLSVAYHVRQPRAICLLYTSPIPRDS